MFRDLTLQCTDQFIKRPRSISNGWVITGDREAVATYTAWMYGPRFASRFMRDGARELVSGHWVLPVAPSADAGLFRRRIDATRAVTSLAGIVGYEDGRLGRPQRDHGIAVRKIVPVVPAY